MKSLSVYIKEHAETLATMEDVCDKASEILAKILNVNDKYLCMSDDEEPGKDSYEIDINFESIVSHWTVTFEVDMTRYDSPKAAFIAALRDFIDNDLDYSDFEDEYDQVDYSEDFEQMSDALDKLIAELKK